MNCSNENWQQVPSGDAPDATLDSERAALYRNSPTEGEIQYGTMRKGEDDSRSCLDPLKPISER